MAAGGWYVYATAFPIPPVRPGSSKHILTVTGQILVDNNMLDIYLENPAGDPTSCRPVGIPAITEFSTWNSFRFVTPVIPDTHGYLYFVVHNGEQSIGNPTGLRVEFTSAYFIPE